MNDLNHHRDIEIRAIVADFERTYRAILNRTATESTARLVLVSPFFGRVNPESGSREACMLERIPRYVGVVEKLAAEFGARYVTMQEIFPRHARFRPAQEYVGDAVHPTRLGHIIIAESILAALCGE